jgi:hypothetical protein
MANGNGLVIDTTLGQVLFPSPQAAQLPPMVISEQPVSDNGNQRVLIGALAILLIILAGVGLRSHNS